MKVIKKGREQKGWAKKFKCTGNGHGSRGCGATLLVKKTDLYVAEQAALYLFLGPGLFMSETAHLKTFRCSECGVQTNVPLLLSGIRFLEKE